MLMTFFVNQKPVMRTKQFKWECIKVKNIYIRITDIHGTKYTGMDYTN